MYPDAIHIGTLVLSVWNAVFAMAVLLASVVFLRSLDVSGVELRWPVARYFVFVYLSALAAQVFAYAFDANTLMTPPPGTSFLRWYLDPLAGPKTLYGVFVLAPLSVAVATAGSGLSVRRGLDVWTSAILVVLCVVRVGCLLQGCCYGVSSDLFGITFPAGSPAFGQQVAHGLVPAGSAHSLPVVPTQAIEAAVLALLAAWALGCERKGRSEALFLAAVAAYSLMRFALEFVRGDEGRGAMGPLSTSQWIALAVLGVVAVARRRRAHGASAAA